MNLGRKCIFALLLILSALFMLSCEESDGNVTELTFVNSSPFTIDELILYNADNGESVILKNSEIEAGETLTYRIRWTDEYLEDSAVISVTALHDEYGNRYLRKTVDKIVCEDGSTLETITFLYDEEEDSFYVELTYSGDTPTTEETGETEE
ncbi:MAG: hypothetical protein LUI01_02840 [Firmicutes bacterium]|nr:hypothetical protein [Bacillota bacterium]MCD7831193.1 hypothetical protein [Bacillota bacterium]